MRILLPIILLVFTSYLFGETEDILEALKKNDYSGFEKFFVQDKISLEIKTKSMTIRQSYYSSRQSLFILKKFFNNFTLKKLDSSESSSDSGTIVEEYLFKVTDKKRDQESMVKFTVYITKLDGAVSISKLLIKQSD